MEGGGKFRGDLGKLKLSDLRESYYGSREAGRREERMRPYGREGDEGCSEVQRPSGEKGGMSVLWTELGTRGDKVRNSVRSNKTHELADANAG